jgi:hypothetical protein
MDKRRILPILPARRVQTGKARPRLQRDRFGPYGYGPGTTRNMLAIGVFVTNKSLHELCTPTESTSVNTYKLDIYGI